MERNLSKLFFNTNKVAKLIDECNLTLAQAILNEILGEFPDDNYANYLQARILMLQNKFDLALDYIEDIDKYFLVKTLIVIYLDDYDRMTDLYYKFYHNYEPKEFLDRSFNITFYKLKKILQKKLNIFDDIESSDNYNVKQIENYSELDAIEHIKSHHCDENILNKSQFNSSINIEELFYKIKNAIKNNTDCRLISNFNEIYLVSYPNCGVNNETGKIRDYILVVTNIYSDEIITMYPVDNVMSYQNVVYLDRNETHGKVKIKSQIEKFKEKYNM